MYKINPHLMLRHDTVQHIKVTELLKLSGWKPQRKTATTAKN